MSKVHQKHAKLSKPSIGFYHRNEWAILGAPCSRIETLVQGLTQALSSTLNIGYIDADHHAGDQSAILKNGATLNYTNKINFHQWESKGGPTDFEAKILFRKLELLIVNGNHFQAKKQILILDERKFDSLQRKKERLTDVTLILTTPELKELPDFLKEVLPAWKEIPTFDLADIQHIAAFLKTQTAQNKPVLKGLVLAGGKSQRMGFDKGTLVYHQEKTQRQYVYELLQDSCSDVFLSCRPDQVENLENDFKVLPDRLTGLGPFAAILSAFQLDPDAAWLVVACDLPFVDSQTIAQLIQERDLSKTATAFHNPDSGFPEPLITIWESRAYVDLLHFLSLGYSCPRKVLINTDVKQVKAENIEWIKNVNTPQELEEAKSQLKT